MKRIDNNYEITIVINLKYTEKKMTIDRTVNVHVSMYKLRFDELFTDVQYWGMLCDVQVGYDLGVKTVLVSACFGAQCSVEPARGQQFKERVSWVWGVQSDFLSPFPHSGGVKFLEAGQRGTIILSAVLTVRCSLLMSVLEAEPNQTVIDEHRTVSMMAE